MIVLGVCLLHAFPNYEYLRHPEVVATWRNAAIKWQNPFADMTRLFPRASHEAKLNFRLTVPLLAKVLHLGTGGLLALFAACGIVSLYAVLAAGYRLTGSRIAALWLCLSVGCAWPGALPFHQLLGGFYDAVAICLVLLAMTVRSSPLAGLLAFAAAWTDERALLALALVFLLERNSALLAGILGYGVARWYCAAAYGLGTAWDGTGMSVLLKHFNVIPLGIWSGLSGGWLVVVCGLTTLVVRRKWGMTAAMGLALGAAIASALCVEDVTRSMSYAVPAVLLGAGLVAMNETEETTERLAMTAALISVLTPMFFVQTDAMTWMLPLPLQAIRLILYPRFG